MATLPPRGPELSAQEQMEGILCRKQEMESFGKKAANRYLGTSGARQGLQGYPPWEHPQEGAAVRVQGSKACRPQVLAECILCAAAWEPGLLQGREGGQRWGPLPRGSACQSGQGPRQRGLGLPEAQARLQAGVRASLNPLEGEQSPGQLGEGRRKWRSRADEGELEALLLPTKGGSGEKYCIMGLLDTTRSGSQLSRGGGTEETFPHSLTMGVFGLYSIPHPHTPHTPHTHRSRKYIHWAS